MDLRNLKTLLGAPLLAAALISFASTTAWAHCDGVDGPVVAAARRALEARNPTFVLIWVQRADEAEIKTAFERTLAVRVLGPEARDLADRFFFETLVRVHRAGEGAPFTGLKPAGRDLGAAIPAADRAVETGSLEPLAKLLSESVGEHLREQFHRVESAKRFAPSDVQAGRDYVKAYVEFIHYVERVYEASATSPHGHGPK